MRFLRKIERDFAALLLAPLVEIELKEREDA
jgi:hypothetical protein